MGAGAVSLVAAAAMATLPAYGNETPSPTESSNPGTSAPPTVTPSGPVGEPSTTPSDPGTTSTPGPGPTTGPTDPPLDPPPPDEVPVDLGVTVPGSKVTIGSSGKDVRVDVDNTGYGTAQNVVLTIEVGDLTEDVAVELPGANQDCEVDGTKSVCRYPDLEPDDTDSFVTFRVTPQKGAELGEAGTVHVTVTSDNPERNSEDNTAAVAIELIGHGPDLNAYAAPIGPVKPGGREDLQAFFFNEGDEPVAGFSATITLPRYATFAETYPFCVRSGDRRQLVCTAADAPLEPGEGWDVSDIFTVAVSKGAPGPRVLGRGAFTVTPILEGSAAAKRGGSFPLGQKIGARVAGGDAVEGDNTVAFAVKTKKNPADTAIRVPKAEGEAGDTVKVRFRITNRGPADIDGFRFALKAPTGADIDGHPSNPLIGCAPENGGVLNDREADCYYALSLRTGKSLTFTIPLVIVAEKVGTDGKAAVEGFSLGGDPNLKNNTAKVIIGPPGSAGGGGGGDGLPITGTSLAGLIGGGALAVLLGGALYLVARRRRTAEVAPGEDVATV